QLGLIANQLKEVLPALDRAGWDGLFRVRAISELVGSKKPDLAIFRWALDRAGCRPEEAVMIGDRVDNDIAPAKRIGMRTIWLHFPHAEKGTSLQNKKDRMYLESQRRISIVSIPPKSEEDAPDAEADSAKGVLEAIQTFDRPDEPV
ncbi:MAG: HAD-IA family hydrolase, partial [Candidatus Eisenbacteria bacterium]|nr:HAD-IA family hydrolase [Candidatus Eisenbacteria bacterium]